MTASTLGSACPQCQQRAPVVVRGLDSRCAACGAPRFLLAAPSVGLAGQPSRVGGLAAIIAGLSVLVLGLSFAGGLWLLLQSLWPASLIGWAFALPVGAASLLFGLLLLFGGSRLRKSGQERRSKVQLEAVRALVQHRRGPISALDVARALELPEPQVDELLTQLAREKATEVTLDVDRNGHVVYDFEGEARRWRVLEEQVNEAESAAQPPESAAAQHLKR